MHKLTGAYLKQGRVFFKKLRNDIYIMWYFQKNILMLLKNMF